MITENIQKQIAEAMKARDEIRLSTLRMLASALNYEKIAKQHDLSGDEEMAVVKKEAKKRQDAMEAYEKAGAADRVEKESKELEILKAYLPEELSQAETVKLVEEVIKETGAESIKDMGKVMGLVMQRSGGRADGKKVADFVKAKLV